MRKQYIYTKKPLTKQISLYVLFLLIFFLGYLLALQLYECEPEFSTPHYLQPLKAEKVLSATTYVLAVTSEGAKGTVGNITVEIIPGSGRVLMNTNPFLETDTQYSAETAVHVAQLYTRTSLKDKDVIISFGLPARVLGGPSAGAAITVAVIAAIEERELDKNTAITGTIEPDGTIGKVAGIIEKGLAAAQHKIKKYIVPKGQEKLIYYEKEYRDIEILPSVYTRKVFYTPKTLDLNDYTKSQWNMTTVGVENIAQAVKWMIK